MVKSTSAGGRAAGRLSLAHTPATVWLCACLLVTAGLAVGAQGVPPQGPPPPDSGMAPQQPPPASQEEAASRRETVRLYLVHRMRETLQLSDAQTLKVLDVLEALDKERQAHQETMGSLQAQLREAIGDQATTDAAFRDRVAEVRKEQVRFESAARGLDERLLAIFTPRQQAQYLVLRRNLLEQIRQDEPGGQRPNRPAGRWRR